MTTQQPTAQHRKPKFLSLFYTGLAIALVGGGTYAYLHHGAAAAPTEQVTYSVTGTAPSILVAMGVAGGPASKSATVAPGFTQTVTAPQGASLQMDAYSAAAGTTVVCTIAVNGAVVDTESANDSGLATCTAGGHA